MDINLSQVRLTDINAQLIVIAAFSKRIDDHEGFKACDKKLEGYLGNLVSQNKWTAEKGQNVLLHTFGKLPARQLLLLGLGKHTEATPGTLRKAAADAIKRASELDADTVALFFPELNNGKTVDIGQAIAEGAAIANYRFPGYKRDKETAPSGVARLLVTDVPDKLSDEVNEGIRRGSVIAEGVNVARTLVNAPANMMTPSIMAQAALDMAESHQMTCEVLEQEQMQELGMGALLAVAKGSSEPPKLIVLRYQGRDTWEDAIGLVGKGITFDSGGLSIKTRVGMETMKTDMGGAASVLGTMKAIAQLRPAVNVIAVIPAAENMPSGNAYRPGDVITAMTGKTIEVLNTDAEGRLALADATAYAKAQGATRIVDLATLTGAALVALGKVTTAVMTNDDAFLEGFLTAASRTEEKVWQLPAFEEYRKLIESDIADVKNTGGPHAGTITAGLFIQTFVEDTPWIHLDIAGTAFSDKATELHGKGATGVMVRSLTEYISSYDQT